MSVPFRMYDPQRTIDPEQTVMHLPASVQVDELKSAEAYPNTAERVVRFIRDVLAALALAMVIVTLALAARFMVSVAAAIDDLRSTSTVTGCPFGTGECGG